MNSPENARLALRRPQELVPQPEAGDSLEVHCRPDDRQSRGTARRVELTPPGRAYGLRFVPPLPFGQITGASAAVGCRQCISLSQPAWMGQNPLLI